MKPNNATKNTVTPSGASRAFTVQQANQALVFVRKVVQDLVDGYARLMELRAERDERALRSPSEAALEELNQRIERLAGDLGGMYDELNNVGCELKDWSEGLIDFPAMHEGRRVLLCWKLGEPAVAHWHELNAGFGGRRTITPDFGREPPDAL